jgi:hypothetical protein
VSRFLKPRYFDFKNKKIGRLTVIDLKSSGSDGTFWNCICDCGNLIIVRSTNLKKNTKSCGCLRKETKSNLKHGLYGTPSYKIWNKMIQRCTNEKELNYSDYGKKGIKVCDEWLISFESFYKDMGERPNKLTLDRIDNNKGYFKENCRWATMTEQQNNRTNNVKFEFNGKSKTLPEWSRIIGIKTGTLRSRISSGWDIQKALSTIARSYNK